MKTWNCYFLPDSHLAQEVQNHMSTSLPNKPSQSTIRRNPTLYSGLKSNVVDHQSDSVVQKVPEHPKRIRQSTKPLLNKLETQWFEILRCRWSIVVPQGMRFMLANGVWYKPDFVCFTCGLEIQSTTLMAYECKGPHAFRGGKENLKIAAHKYPYIIWILVWRENNEWQEQRIYP